ncbi:hypothetical protein NW762_013423 [Fusarium torreyae]|uniref:Uncharacterized protein n=1 Tax=Fusarium torreyae TaxID=1237075 RepID=A0A9W8RKR0_9HYPO|nr:hypothetical protein NW762_013423 [Fusarium torreyae]
MGLPINAHDFTSKLTVSYSDVLKRHVKGHSTQERDNAQDARDEEVVHVVTNPPQSTRTDTDADRHTELQIESPAPSPCPSLEPSPSDQNSRDPTMSASASASDPSHISPEPLARNHSPRRTTPHTNRCPEPTFDPPGLGALPTLSPPRSDLQESPVNAVETTGYQTGADPDLTDVGLAVQGRTSDPPSNATLQNSSLEPIGSYLDNFSVIDFSRSGHFPPGCQADLRHLDRDELAWLSTFNCELPSPSGIANIWDMIPVPTNLSLINDPQSLTGQKHSLGSDIPEERFAKIARLWPRKREPPWQLIQTLWSDAAEHGADNLFSDHSVDDINDNSPSLRKNGPRRGLDDARRMELAKEFAFIQNRVHQNGNLPDENAYDTKLPSADTLGMCIDLYFQRFSYITGRGDSLQLRYWYTHLSRPAKGAKLWTMANEIW